MTEHMKAAQPVYGRMLREYIAAANMLLVRQDALKAELKQVSGTAFPTQHQRDLEQRIRLLHTEYEETVEVIEQLRFYAEKELHA